MNAPFISIYIITRNRRKLLERALESCFAQEYPHYEVLVLDDASADGTADAVHRDFPQARFLGFDANRGSAALRNVAFRETEGKIVVGLDDDAYYTSRQTLDQLAEDFRDFSDAAVIAMPFVEPARESAGLIHADPSIRRGSLLRTFTGCAYAIRRDAALKIGGQEELFFHRVIDREISLRLLDAGFCIRFGGSDPVVHEYSPQRDWANQYWLSVRNTFLFDWMLVPRPYLLRRLVRDAIGMTVYKLTSRELLRRLGYVAKALHFIACHRRSRHPVSAESYRRFLSLPAHGPLPFLGEPPLPAHRT